LYVITYKTKDDVSIVERDINQFKRLTVRMKYLIKTKSVDHIIAWEYKHTIAKLNLSNLEKSYDKIGYENILYYFEDDSKIKDKFENVVEKACKEKKLKFINRIFLNFLLELFEIKTKVIYLEKSPKIQDPTEKLIKILKKYNATEYLSGGLAQNYLREELFSDADLKLKYVDYENLIKPFVNNSNINYINYSSLQFFLES